MEIYKNDNSKQDLHRRIVSNYEEILESVLNSTFVKHLKEEVSADLYVGSDGQILTEATFGARSLKKIEGNLGLGEILKLLESPEKLKGFNLDLAFKNKTSFFKFCRTELLELTKNKFDNVGSINQKEAMMVRNIILGVGCKGVINSLICLFHEDEFMDSYFRKVA